MKIKIKILVLFIVSITLSSCLDDNLTDFGNTPVLVQFESPTSTAIFLKDAVNPETFNYNIPVVIIGGRNVALDKDVQFTYEVDATSTATANEYSLVGEKTLTLPAGETTVNIPITVPAGNLDPFNPKTLVLKIASSSEVVSESDKTAVLLQAACVLDMSTFVGSYTANKGGADYTVTAALGPEPNTLEFTNIDGGSGGGTQNAIIELSSDVTQPTITYRSKEFNSVIYVHPLGAVTARTVSPELSFYNSCDNSMTLEFKRCIPDDRCFGGTRIVKLVKN